jgi:DNA uptake protein ComE-like DNA-binding protein
MIYLYIILINVILIFILYVVLNNKIKKNSKSTLLDTYAGEVETLIVELNRAVEDVLNVSEERISDLKKLIKRAEKLLKNTDLKKAQQVTVSTAAKSTPGDIKEVTEQPASGHMLERTRHLLSMGHSKEEISRILNINRAEVDLL